MKKVFSIILCAVAVAGFSSCKHEEDDIFNESSALRTNHAVATYSELLTSAENGWVMEYFANGEEPGYPMLVKFDANGAVTIAAKNHYSSNNVYATEESLYEVIADNGPVLSFNSYNTLFHIFADPADIPDTGTPENPDDETGLGHEGDYEFVIYDGDEDHFRMKGKKHGLEINMYKLPADQPWDTYYDKLDEIKNSYFSSLIETVYLAVGEERYTITGMSKGLFNFVPEGGDPISQTVTIPYIVRLDGTVHLCAPFEGENENFSVQNFTLANDGTLQCIDENQSAVVSGPTIDEIFLNRTWMVDFDSVNGEFATLLNSLKIEHTDILGSELLSLQFMPNSSTDLGHSLRFSFGSTSRPTSGNIYVGMGLDGVNLKYSYNGTGDRNGLNMLNLVSGYTDLLNWLSSSTFAITVESLPLCPIRLRVTNTSNADDWFVLEKVN